MVELVIRDEVRRLVPATLRRSLGRRLRAALRQLGRSRSQVTVLLTGDAEIRALNRRYRKLDRATDVLSFHQQKLRGEEDEAGDGVFLGDIVISAETALRRASGRRLPGELARLAIHGLCHLFGHDHHRLAEAKRMRALESRLLRRTRGSQGRFMNRPYETVITVRRAAQRPPVPLSTPGAAPSRRGSTQGGRLPM